MPVPSLSGRYLAHNRESLVVRAFMAADLVTGRRRLERPTRLQAAALARVNPTYVTWAQKRMAERWLIEAGFVPLVPASIVPKLNVNTLPVPITGRMPDSDLVDFVRSVGVNRVLEAAVAVEAAE
jgi:hypothetical protein